ncbi:MAG: dephospho-CoA kinase [Anaerolineae bacterium]|nr:dephospho-CoA kinase [Anaerolineae bacterium]
MSDKIVIGLTGNIATGKSLVLRMLQELGATVIDADKLAHLVMRKGTPVYQAIIEEFGKFILDDDGEINRAKLGSIVFKMPQALTKLEGLTHPAVRKLILKRIADAPTKVVAVEAIKLFESGLAEHCESTWVVVAPPELQLKRLVERRKMPADQAKQRIRTQSPQQEKIAKADVVVDNSGDLVKTWAFVKKRYTELLAAHDASHHAEPEPAPASTAPAATAEINTNNISIRRAKPNDLGTIAQLIGASTGGVITPDPSQMMEALFSRAYIVAQAGDTAVGVAGWQTENLIAGLQDVHVLRDDLWDSVGTKMMEMIHEEVDKLSCEVVIAFVSNKIGAKPIEFLVGLGYEQSEVAKLGYMWKDAAAEWQPDNTIVLYRKLREQRIMVPM